MTHLRQRMQEDLRLRNFSERTVRHYARTVAEFAKYSTSRLINSVLSMFGSVFCIRLTSGSLHGDDQARPVGAEVPLHADNEETWFDQEVIKPKVRRKLPTVWSREEDCALLDAEMNIKHRALLALCYSAGLRCQEALDPKVTDIDSKRMTINIREGKGSARVK